MGGEKPTILVVDDEESSRDVIRMAISRWGFEASIAGDGREALEVFDDRIHALAIVDVVLPGIGGIEVMRALKTRSPATSVILTTAYGTINDAVIAIREGALDFLTKPIDFAKLRMLVEGCADRWERKTHRAPEPASVSAPRFCPADSGDRPPESKSLIEEDKPAQEQRLKAGILTFPGGRFRGPGSSFARE